MSWDTSEDKLVSDIACMFFDSQTVKSVPSDYARAVIKAVREHDATRRPRRSTVRTAMDVALECEERLDALSAAMTPPPPPSERSDKKVTIPSSGFGSRPEQQSVSPPEPIKG